MAEATDTQPLRAEPSAEDLSLHKWVKQPASEPLRCAKCGTYYVEAKANEPCPAMKASA